jgi:mono/diheme cytochrome c family protein
MKNSMRYTIVLSAILIAGSACTRSPAEDAARAGEDPLARGKELVSVGGCNHCHTPMVFDAKIGMPVPDAKRKLSGHPADVGDPDAAPGKGDQAVIGSTFTSFRAPFGVVYASNLTPDRETGLGTWTSDEFIATMRSGHKRGKGRMLLPPMPWQNIAALSDADLRAVFAYLQSLPPVHNAVPAAKVAPEAIAAIEKSFAAAANLEH